jgi:hypothetical protein
MTEFYNYQDQMSKLQNRMKLWPGVLVMKFYVWFLKLLRQDMSNLLELNRQLILKT